MDLQNFQSQLMYFDLETPAEVEVLLQKASSHYGEGDAERFLQAAACLAPDNLQVLVAQYRFFFYQHRRYEALAIADRVLQVVAPMIHFPDDWRQIRQSDLIAGLCESFTLVRFYLMALKGAGYINLSLGETGEGVCMLNKVIELDTSDRLGARSLMQAVGATAVA